MEKFDWNLNRVTTFDFIEMMMILGVTYEGDIIKSQINKKKDN